MAESIVSGFRPTGKLHLGHLHGALGNWVRLQSEYRCFFFVADWHALTTGYDSSAMIRESTEEMVVDWLSVGLDPERAVIFRLEAFDWNCPQHITPRLTVAELADRSAPMQERIKKPDSPFPTEAAPVQEEGHRRNN